MRKVAGRLALASVMMVACRKPVPAESVEDAGNSAQGDAGHQEQVDGGSTSDGGAPDASTACGDGSGTPVTCTGDFTVTTAAGTGAVQGCERITGSVTISAPDLVDLSALHCLETVDGDFHIGGRLEVPDPAPATALQLGPVLLTSLAGLDNLTTVGGTLRVGARLLLDGDPRASVVAGPVMLSSLGGVPNLRSVGGLELAASVDGFDPGHHVTAGLVLRDLSALNGVEVTAGTAARVHLQLGGAPVMLPALVLHDNVVVELSGAAITSLAGPRWPQRITTLALGNTALTSLSGLLQTPPVTVLRDLRIGGNPLLASLAGLESVVTSTMASFRDNPMLTDFSGFGATRVDQLLTVIAPDVTADHALKVTSAGAVHTAGFTSVLAHLESATWLGLGTAAFTTDFGVDLTIPLSSTVGGLSSLTHVDTGIFANLRDADLSGLSSLTSATRLAIDGSQFDPTGALTGAAVTSLSGLNASLTVDVLSIVHTSVTTLTELPSLPALRELDLTENANLTSLAGQASLDSLTTLHLFRDDSLLDFTGLPPLPALHTLQVEQNNTLHSLNGLDKTAHPTTVVVAGNPQLAQCAVDAYRGAVGLGVDVAIASGNTTGNASFCACHPDGSATCPDPRCTSTSPGTHTIASQADADAFMGVTCVDLLYILDGVTTLTLPNLVSAEMLAISSSTLQTLTLPALQQVGRVSVSPGGAMPTLSMPALTDVTDLWVSCNGVATPAAALDLPALQRVGVVDIQGCANLPLCAVERDLAAASVVHQTLMGLNSMCTCDAAGDVVANSCG